ncbi:MAG: type II secretion system protein N [Halopseudomonas sp.]
MLNSDDSHNVRRFGYIGWLAWFVAWYLVLMMLWVPVDWIYQQQKQQLPPIGRLTGTFWQGAAEDVELPIVLRSVSWQWAPSALLQGGLGYQLSLDKPQNQATLSANWDQTIKVSGLQLSGRLSDWLSSFQGQSLPLDVDISASLTEGVFSLQGCSELQQGRLYLQNWQGMMSDSLNRIGQIEAKLNCIEGQLQVAFQGDAPDVAMTGLWLLDPDQSYSLKVEARPQSPDVRDSLSAAGFDEQSAGVWQLQRKGRL